MLRFCCLMKVRRERRDARARSLVQSRVCVCVCVCVREIIHTHTHIQRTHSRNDSRRGGCAAAEEEGSELIVFLRINIINVIQQSVLDEGAITPGKIHSTSLIGAAIDRPRSGSAFRFRLRAIRHSREPRESRQVFWHGKRGRGPWNYYLTKDRSRVLSRPPSFFFFDGRDNRECDKAVSFTARRKTIRTR